MRLACLFALLSVAGCYDAGDLGKAPYKCSATYPECPDGYTCQLTSSPFPMYQNRCVKDGLMGAALTVPKTGMYTGQRLMQTIPMAECMAAEPNNTIAQAAGGFDGGGTQSGLAICPADDVDVYAVNAANEYVTFSISYLIRNGDLDIGLFDMNGNLIASDADFTRDNACVSTVTKLSGLYYAVVVGAKNPSGTTDQNRYSMVITRSATSPRPCAGGGADLSTPPDMAF